MNILHTETLKRWGGQQNRVLMEAKGLQERGHKVIIACNRGSVLAQKAKAAGIKVYELDMNKKTYFKTIPQLIKIIKEENIDIVSTHSSVDSWAGGIAAKLTGRKLVRFRHNLYPIGRDPLTRLIYTLPDTLIAISEEVKNVLAKCGAKNKVIIIHDSVNTDIFDVNINNDIRNEIDIDSKEIIIGNTSTFTYVKGQEILLRAFNIIATKTDCILLFAGRLVEESKQQYLSYVQEKFRNRVIFLGHRDDIPCVLKTIDIFVYPSILEGLGTALLEAMAMKRPVVVSDIPTFRYFIQDGINGVFFRSRSPEDLAEKILTLIRNKDQRNKLGKNARFTILEKFTTEQMINKTETLYKELLNNY